MKIVKKSDLIRYLLISLADSAAINRVKDKVLAMDRLNTGTEEKTFSNKGFC
jgi:hypothetical protein